MACDLSSPEYVLYTRPLAAPFSGTPYAHDALGLRPSFDATTVAMIERFHAQWYAPNNAIVVIVGDVDPETAAGEVERLFGNIPSRSLPARPAVKLGPVAPHTLRLESDRPVGFVVTAFRMPGCAG